MRDGPARAPLRSTMQSPSVLARRLEALAGRLAEPRVQLAVLGAAVLLAATSVGPHRALDDYVLGLIARGQGASVGLPRGTLDLFTFTTGDPAGNRRLMDVGLMLPWWTDEHLRIAFFRPVSSLTHWLDERLWPSSAVLMHLHSLAWFGAFLAAARLMYRRLEASPVVAGLAFTLYALDDAHAAALTWIANRNALIAGTFGCLALFAHDVWRREGRSRAAVGATAAWLAGLLAGELAVGTLAYLIAYAVFVEPGSLRQRARSLGPYVLTLAAWRLAWGRSYGARGSGAYVDPLANPLSFLAVAPAKLAVLLHGQFSFPPSDVAFLGPPTDAPLVLSVAALTVAAILFLLLPVLRNDRTSHFWAAGMFLSALPLAATFPSDRLLLFVGIGAMPLLARLFVLLVGSTARGEPVSRGRLVLGAAFAAMHLVVAPLMLVARAGQMEVFGRAHETAAAAIPTSPDVRERTVVVLSCPVILFANYIQAERELEGTPRPAHLYALSVASSHTVLVRTGPVSVEIRPDAGFLYSSLDRHYRADPTSLRPGDTVELSAMTARVVSARPDGRPDTVEFTFGRNAAEYLFFAWKNGRFVPVELPSIGGRLEFPEEDFGKIMMQTALRGL